MVQGSSSDNNQTLGFGKGSCDMNGHLSPHQVSAHRPDFEGPKLENRKSYPGLEMELTGNCVKSVTERDSRQRLE